jgi:hypothetical protein
MKKSEVEIGEMYIAKVSGNLTTVNCHTAGAWTACGGLHCDLRAIDEVVLDIEEIEHTYRIPVCVRHYYECITMSTPKLLQDIRAGKLNGLWRDKQGNVMENNELLNKI